MAKSDAREEAYGGYQNAPKGAPSPSRYTNPTNRPTGQTGSYWDATAPKTSTVRGSSFTAPRGVLLPVPVSQLPDYLEMYKFVVDPKFRANPKAAAEIGWNRLYTAYSNEEGQPKYQDTIPTWKAESLADYQWLFDIVAADYYHTATGAKTYDDPDGGDGFVQQALKDFDLTGRYTNVVQAAYEYAQRQGLLTDNGKLTPKGQEAWKTAYDEDKGGGRKGGSGGYRGGGGGGGGGGGSSQIDLTNPTTARGLIQQTIKQVLGRDATRDEVSEFIKILNEAEANNPRTVTSSGSGVTVTGGTDASVIAVDYAESLPDFEDRQASQYYKAFMQAMVGGGM